MFELTEAQHSLWYRIILLVGTFIIAGNMMADTHRLNLEYRQYRIEAEQQISHLENLVDTLSAANRQANFINRETECLAKNIYFEAAGEDLEGKIAVAEVTRNRVRSESYPKTYCGVVYQRNNERCAFSWTCDNVPDRIRDQDTFLESMDIARNIVVRNRTYGVVDRDVTFYHADYVTPNWSTHFEQVKKIGQHIFYRGNDGNKR